MKDRCRVHVCHVAGTRMIEQGSDGLSRGNVAEGVMRGQSINVHIPIHIGALERSKRLLAWFQAFAGPGLEVLTPEGWFTRGHNLVNNEVEINVEGMKLPKMRTGDFLWVPPPAAAGVAVEQLQIARHKCFISQHIFIVPRLMQTLWRKQLCKAADVVLTLPPRASCLAK